MQCTGNIESKKNEKQIDTGKGKINAMHKEESMKIDQILYQHSVSDDSNLIYEPHCHTTCEIYYLLEGDVECTVEGTVYCPKPQSLLLIEPQKFHSTKVLSNRNYHRIRIHFAPDLLTEEEQRILLKPFYKNNIYYEDISQYHLEQYFDSVGKAVDLGKEIQDIAFCTRTKALLTQIFAISSEVKEKEVAPNADALKIMKYVKEHLTENMTLEGLADTFFISRNHLTNIFKKATGTTVNNYILFKRIALAQEYMKKGDSLTEAAYKSGFNDYSSFYRSYKKVCGIAPSGK